MSRDEAIKELRQLLHEDFLSEYSEAIRTAIKALQKEPCDDCIRRSDIGLTDFEIVMCNGDYKEGLKMLLDKIEKAPSATPQPNKWNPVSERLPEEAGMYLCSYDDDDVGTSYFDISMNEFNVLHEQVTAWMYLPEPYNSEIPTGAEGSDKE